MSEIFRQANESLVERFRSLGAVGGLAPFLCECLDHRCTRAVLLTLRDYEDLRADESRFVIVPGHEVGDRERVVATTDRYAVVERSRGDWRLAQAGNAVALAPGDGLPP